MSSFALRILSRVSPLAWAGAVAGIWFLPVQAVVVLTGVAVAGTSGLSVRRTQEQDIITLGRALSGVIEQQPPARHHLRRVQ
jgi:hypothetical protein